MKIMYVEDNFVNVLLIKRLAKDHEVVHYVYGEDVLENFANDNPDLVLMDVQIGGELSGLEIVQRLRSQGFTETPIIAVTAYAMLGDKERCIAAGCTDYLAKPMSARDVVTMFQKYEKLIAERPAKTEEPKTPDSTPSETVSAPTNSTTETSSS